MVLTIQVPQYNYGRHGTVNAGPRPFKSSDLDRLLGDLLLMRNLQLISNPMQEILRVHQKLIDLATTTVIPDLHSILVPYLKTSAALMSSNGIAATEPAFQKLFTSVVHQVVYRYVSHEPQPKSLIRAPRGCRNCQPCNQLDASLRSARENTGAVFVPFKKDVNHLTRLFVKKDNRYPYHQKLDDITTRTQLESPPYSFESTKVDRPYNSDFQRWDARFRETQQLLASIAPEQTLRELSGQRFEELVRLYGTILVRTPDGRLLNPPMYLHQRPPPSVSTTDNAVGASSTAEAGPSASGTLKRKNVAEDQENQEPSAKRLAAVEVIDLSASP